MLQSRAELGVEVSGHHFFGLLGGGDDGLFTALVVLGLLDECRRGWQTLFSPWIGPPSRRTCGLA